VRSYFSVRLLRADAVLEGKFQIVPNCLGEVYMVSHHDIPDEVDCRDPQRTRG
jgi:hypothetical protein